MSASLSLNELLTLERKGWDSLCRSEGGSFYGELMAPSAVMILVNGMILDRPTIANSLNDSPAWSSYTIENARVIPSGDNSAILVYEATAHRDGEDAPFTALMSSHYAIEDGKPVLMLYQQTTATH